MIPRQWKVIQTVREKVSCRDCETITQPPVATDGRAAAHADWQPQYTFDLAQVAAEDLEQCNHWTSTREGSRFTTLHVATIPQQTGFASLVGRDLTLYGPAGTERRTLENVQDYLDTLRGVFHIALSKDEARALTLFA